VFHAGSIPFSKNMIDKRSVAAAFKSTVFLQHGSGSYHCPCFSQSMVTQVTVVNDGQIDKTVAAGFEHFSKDWGYLYIFICMLSIFKLVRID
jgi:hypothetical protein